MDMTWGGYYFASFAKKYFAIVLKKHFFKVITIIFLIHCPVTVALSH